MRIGILGHFGIGLTLLNGQTVKSNNLADALEKYTDIEVRKIDSHGWTRAPFRLLNSIKTAFRDCDAVIMLPAHNGVKVFSPLLLHYRKKYKKKIFYDVIGGWLPKLVSENRGLAKSLKKFDGIWVETSTMKKKLEELGFDNVVTVPNFKELSPISAEELVADKSEPYRLCTFSRVMKEKGIETAANVITDINEKLGHTVFELDIYGQVDSAQTEWFDELKARFPEYIRYCGCVDSSKSVEMLRSYFALLFPTHFYTEGIPGTIIDAYAAGIPVISARWESFADVIDDGETGIGYSFDDTSSFEKVLTDVAADPGRLNRMKAAALKKSDEFLTSRVVGELIKMLGD